MAGHSKWANIKHRKERADAKKGKVFSRIVKEIISAVRQGGPDQKNNPKLRLVLQKAKAVNLPNDNIEKNIKKASNADQEDYIEMVYELYGYGGVGIIADVMTDNKNRIASEMRIATNKRGGNIAQMGSVSFNFDRKGVLYIDKNSIHEEELFLQSAEAGAEEFYESREVFKVFTAPDLFYEVKEKLENCGAKCLEANLEMIPKTYVSCSDDDQEANMALIEWLESIDDVDVVYHNMQIDDRL